MESELYKQALINGAVNAQHKHANKSLLDTYTQSDSSVASAVSLKHAHSNFSLIDAYTQTDSSVASAVSLKHAAGSDVPNASYRTVATAMASHVAGKVAGTYMLGCGDPAAVSGTGTLYPIVLIPIYTADIPTVNGVTTKLRIQTIISVNNVAPTGNFTVGLYPINSGAGGTAVKIYTTGTLVTGSAAPTVTTPAGSSMTSVVGSDFALPADGVYCLAIVTTATVATSSLVEINAVLQMRNA